MEELTQTAFWHDLAETVEAWLRVHVAQWHVLGQVVAIVVLFVVAVWVARRIEPRLAARIDGHVHNRRLADVLTFLNRRLRLLLFMVGLWIASAVALQVTWPSQSYLIRLVATLVTAWAVISILTRTINQPFVARMAAIVIWSIAALSILDWLDPTLAALESLALTIGEARISLLVAIKAALLLVVLLWSVMLIGRLIENYLGRARGLTPSVQVLLSKIARLLLATIAVVVALDTVGIDLTMLAVLSGAIGVGIGFGLQKIVSNLISGLLLLVDRSIKPGDVIELGDTFGWITHLGARYVSVVTRDGKEYLIPNEDLITQRVVNWSHSNNLVRLEIAFGVSYDTDPHLVRRIAREAATKPDRVLAEPKPVCHVVGFGDNSIDFVLRFWITDAQAGITNVRGEVFLALWDTFKENGVDIPFPQRVLHFAGNDKVDERVKRPSGETG